MKRKKLTVLFDTNQAGQSFWECVLKAVKITSILEREGMDHEKNSSHICPFITRG